MIKFFRKIRYQLLREGKTGKYLKYAIGEIVLVVVGILIALSINNWNEERKNGLIEISYLEEIKDNLIQDTLDLTDLELVYDLKLTWFKQFDSTFAYTRIIKLSKIDTVQTSYENFNRPRSFRPKIGSYNSLIADGQSALISNKQLFSKFQNIYEVRSKNLSSIYETIKFRSENIQWKYTRIMNNFPFMNITNIIDEELIADLHYYYEYVLFYYIMSNRHKELIIETIEDIDRELAFLSLD